MHPGNLSETALSRSEGEIQLPKSPWTPSFGVGIVSRLFCVQITVLLSTRATSRGSVVAR